MVQELTSRGVNCQPGDKESPGPCAVLHVRETRGEKLFVLAPVPEGLEVPGQVLGKG